MFPMRPVQGLRAFLGLVEAFRIERQDRAVLDGAGIQGLWLAAQDGHITEHVTRAKDLKGDTTVRKIRAQLDRAGVLGQLSFHVSDYGAGYEELLGEVVSTKMRIRDVGKPKTSVKAILSSPGVCSAVRPTWRTHR